MPAERLSWGDAGGNPLARAEMWAIPIFGTMASIELISGMLATRSAHVARDACVMGGGLYLLVGLNLVFLGLVGSIIDPNVKTGEKIVLWLVELNLPAGPYVIFAGAVVSAVLSTVDSALLASGSILSLNVVRPVGGTLVREYPLLTTRFAVAGLGLVALVIALRPGTIHDLIMRAASFGSSDLVVVTLFGLFT